jgi:hypothetical protein
MVMEGGVSNTINQGMQVIKLAYNQLKELSKDQ